MQKRFQQDYVGEYIITKQIIRAGQKIQEREWIENSVVNQHISGKSVVVGKGASKNNFDRINLLQHHKGGLLGSKSLQSYGHAVYPKYTAQFIVSNTKQFLQDTVNTGLADKSLIYTNARRIVEYPGQFYLLPHNPQFIETVASVYLACFHQHNEIFLLGFDQDIDSDMTSEMMQLHKLIRTYDTTEFIFVTDENTVPKQLLAEINVEKITYRQFVIQADI